MILQLFDRREDMGKRTIGTLTNGIGNHESAKRGMIGFLKMVDNLLLIR